MDISEFIEKMPAWVETALLERGVTDVTLEETCVTKSNDTVRHGLLFKKEGKCIFPTYYFEDFYKDYGEEGKLEEAARAMVDAYLATGAPMVPDKDIDFDMYLDIPDDDVCFRILDIDINKDYLGGVPYRTMCGSLVMVADLRLGGTGEWRTLITREILDENDHFTEDELFDKAMENSVRFFPPMMSEIGQDLEGTAADLLDLKDEDFPRDKVYVLSNNRRSLGAGAIFYPGLAERIAKLTGGYTVVPSSIHEVILIPDSLNIPYSVNLFMLMDANEHVVDARDVLSYNLFHVNDKGIMSPVILTEASLEASFQAL